MESNPIKIYEFDHFKNSTGIVHCVFTRSGGTSIQPFNSLNIGKNCGDETRAVAENRKRIIGKMGMKPLVFLNQVHGDEIKVLKKDDTDFAVNFEPGKDSYTADAIVSDMKGIFLVIQVADCQAVMLYDTRKQVIANIHCGWRGSINNIIGKCVTKMVDSFGCRPDDILAGISPSLGPCCAEFVNYKDEIPQKIWKYKTGDKNHFDFWKLSVDQLIEKGVKIEHIENMNLCTKCHTKEFYSYRAKKNTGRFACVISMI
ncbi:MAG: peptidoglycan editing factor PgeF [Desulfobacula sp.]|nr:peptidoglycan editing factor PgeF [Desulfobacula sp.]